MARFTVRAFSGVKAGEEWLNSLPPNFVLVGMTDTNAYITFAVEEMPIAQREIGLQEPVEVIREHGWRDGYSQGVLDEAQAQQERKAEK